jgi:hypothetical protein
MQPYFHSARKSICRVGTISRRSVTMLPQIRRLARLKRLGFFQVAAAATEWLASGRRQPDGARRGRSFPRKWEIGKSRVRGDIGFAPAVATRAGLPLSRDDSWRDGENTKGLSRRSARFEVKRLVVSVRHCEERSDEAIQGVLVARGLLPASQARGRNDARVVRRG